MAEKEEWLAAAEAVRVLTPVCGNSDYAAKLTICKRAHAGLVRASAQRLIIHDKSQDTVEVPKEFWWAEGHEALTQNWRTGDFDTWLDFANTRSPFLSGPKVHLQAFGVMFARADIEKMLPAPAPPADAATPATKGGRPPADWWEDLLIDLCFQYFRGDLQPTKQAEIEAAMHEWITAHSFEAATSTIRLRARKVWQAIQHDAEN